MSLGQIIQLAALGVQNLYLNIKPQYTMFRKSYKRHTNYATQVVKVSANGSVGWGAKVDFDLTRNGDLVAETYLVVQLPCITGGIYKEEKWWPTAYKAVPGYVNPDKDHWSHRGDALSAHVGKRHQVDADTKRVRAVVGHVSTKGKHWAGHPICDSADGQTNGTTKDTGTLVGPSHSQVAYVDSLGHAIIKDARFFVAQNVIQEFTGEYMHIHHLMNNPAESLNEALFSYGDDMHAQGPQGGSLADGVGFQASKFGHGAIATGGFWVDMATTATDPNAGLGSLYGDNKTGAYRSTKSNSNTRPDTTMRKNKTDYTPLTKAATSKIGRAMAFLPLASQTYVGMCFHNSSAANAHIDYADKMLDTRSAESGYVAGTRIGQTTGLSYVAIKGDAKGYSNFDDWSGAVQTATVSANFKQALSVAEYYSSADPEKHYRSINDAFSKQGKQEGAFFLVPRGIRSRSQPRGLGLHDHAGYHGSLVRVEDSVGSGTFVSDKFIGLDEFNAMSSVPRILMSTATTTVGKGDIRAKTSLISNSNTLSPFDVSEQDHDLFFGTAESTRHHNAFSLSGYGETANNVRLWQKDTSGPQFAPEQGDGVFVKALTRSDVAGPGISNTIDDTTAFTKDMKVLCLKYTNVKGSANEKSGKSRLAIALTTPALVDKKGVYTEFKAAYDLLKNSAAKPKVGQLIRLQLAKFNASGVRQVADINGMGTQYDGAQLVISGATESTTSPIHATVDGSSTATKRMARFNTRSTSAVQVLTLLNLGFTSAGSTAGAAGKGARIDDVDQHKGNLFRITKVDVDTTDEQICVSFVTNSALTNTDSLATSDIVAKEIDAVKLFNDGNAFTDGAQHHNTEAGLFLFDMAMSLAASGTATNGITVDSSTTNGVQIGLALDLFPATRSFDDEDASFTSYRAPSAGPVFLGYAGKIADRSSMSWSTAGAAGWGDIHAKYYRSFKLYPTRTLATTTTPPANSERLAASFAPLEPPIAFYPYLNNLTDTTNAAIFTAPMAGLTTAEQQKISQAVLDLCSQSLSVMVDDMMRTEFHRGTKQSGSQYFDSESTAGCGPRASLGALMYTAACAQPLGSAPACSQLASDILVPQYSDALVDPANSMLTYGTRIMAALDRSSALSKITGVDGSSDYDQALFDHQNVETARLVKNYNPGPAYEVVSSRLDTTLYSKLRTHAQMNTGFGRRAQISAVGNHQMEDGSGKCVQVVVPMPWWYAEGPACDGRRTQALPMIALQYHNVSISVNLRRLDECVQTDREHRQQPFRCSKMIGSLGASAMKDAASADCPAAAGSSLGGYAQMPSATHGAREGATMIDTLGSHQGMYPQERAVTCVNMHSVKDTLSGMRYTTAAHASAASSTSDIKSGRSGGHLIAATKDAIGASTAPGYQGHVDERHHVDVGTWLNFTSDGKWQNSVAETVSRNTMRIGITDGEFFNNQSNSVFKSNKHTSVGCLTSADASAAFAGGTDGGDAVSWGQGTWDAKMSGASVDVINKLKKVPMAAVFGSAQTNGGFAMHSEAQALANKLCLGGGATVCAMNDAVQNNTDVCSVFNKVNGTMGWKTAGTVTGSKSELQIIGAHLLITYIFLDSSERRLFAANAHEYLLTQVQKQEHHEGRFAQSGTTKQITMDLKFNHPVSHLFWVLQRPESQWAREWFRYEATHGGGDPLMIRAELSLNASKREEENYLNAMNTTVLEPWNYFKKCNNTGIGGALKSHSYDGSAKNIHLYSFAQNPGEWYPTGSLNFSRIDRVELKLYCKAHAESHLTHPLVWGGGGYRELNTELMNAAQTNTVAGVDPDKTPQLAAYGEIAQGINVRVYARNFNVFRIQSGMGALKYAN